MKQCEVKEGGRKKGKEKGETEKNESNANVYFQEYNAKESKH